MLKEALSPNPAGVRGLILSIQGNWIGGFPRKIGSVTSVLA